MKGGMIKFKRHNIMDETGAQVVMEELGRSIDEIYKKNAGKLSFEELYRKAYNLVLHKHAEMLYNRVEEKMQHYLKLALEQRLADRPDEDILRAIEAVWIDHVTSSTMIRDILMYPGRSTPLRVLADGAAWVALWAFEQLV